MSKDLILLLPTRDNPEKFDETINMLYTTADSKDNFDILAIIDDDQLELYGEVMEKYPDIIYQHPAHGGPNSPGITQLQFDFIEQSNYYFNWCLCDDFWGLAKGWDAAILSKKGVYDDGFFTLFTTNPVGRNLNALTTQFRIGRHPFDGHLKPLESDPAFLIYHYHEMLPICTKKWRMALKDLYDENWKGPDHVFICAALAHILSRIYGYSRLMEAGVHYKDLSNDNNTVKVLVNGMNRDQYFAQWARKEDFAIIKPVARKVATQIFHHYKDIMDEPRGVGKFAPEHHMATIKGQ